MMVDAEAHAADIAARLRELKDYGPIAVFTRVGGLATTGEYVKYYDPLPSDKDQRKIGRVGRQALSISYTGQAVAVEVREGRGGAHALALEDITSVEVDHPHGRYMPLHRKRMMRLGISEIGGLVVPRWVDHATEYGARQLLETSWHPDARGVGVVRAYNVTGTEVTDLEAARQLDPNPAVFLLSRGWKYPGTGHEYGMITSRMGYPAGRPLIVRPPNEPQRVPLRHMEMLDLPRDASDAVLLETHEHRMYDLSPEYRYRAPHMDQMQADAMFLYMAYD